MLVGAIFLLAILLTALLTLLLHYCSQKKLLPANYFPSNTPTGISLTFLNSFLFSAILTMMFHASLVNPTILTSALARNTRSESVGIFPENAMIVLAPITTFQPYVKTPEPTTLLTQILDQEETGAATPSPTPNPTPTPVPATPKPEIRSEVFKADTNTPIADGQPIKKESAVYVLSINGKIKGYTSAYLNSLTILKDLIGNDRIVITVKSERVKFLNLETGRLLNANVIALAEWEKFYENEELADRQIENDEVYPTDLTLLTL